MDFDDTTYYLDINGISRHLGPDPVISRQREEQKKYFTRPDETFKFNERNFGLGITREKFDEASALAKIMTAGYFNNSFNDPTLYAGGGLAKRFGKDYYAQLGGLAGIMTGYDDKALSPMAAGLLTLGKKDLGRLNFMYAPGVGDKDSLLMMNLGIPFK